MRRFILGGSLLLLASCVAGGLKPDVFTYPPGYLRAFPLGTITESQLFREIGPPDGEVSLNGTRGYVYRLGQYSAARSYTYLLQDGLIVDVLYHENGPYNGRTARAEQGKP